MRIKTGILVRIILLAASLTLQALPLVAADKPEVLSFDRTRTALLVMDYQNEIVQFIPQKEQGPLLERPPWF